MERWMMRDPFGVVARLEEQALKKEAMSPESRERRAREGLVELFGDEMVEHSFRIRLTSDIVSRLENWGWIMRGPKGSSAMSQTGKICHMLAVQAGAYKYDDLIISPGDEQQRDAMAIQRAWSNHIMPEKHKKLLAMYFIHRTDPRGICRQLAIRFREFDETMVRACHMIENIEIRLASRRNIAHNTGTTGQPTC